MVTKREDEVWACEVTAGGLVPVDSQIRGAVLRGVRCYGVAEVDMRELNEMFPPPRRLSLREMEEAITLALEENIPPPPKEPTQEEQISEWCEANGVFIEKSDIEPKARFYPVGKPPHMAETFSRSMQDCTIGAAVHEADIPGYLAKNDVIKCLPRMEAEFHAFDGNYKQCEAVLPRPMTFKRVRLFNRTSAFVRVD